VVLAATFVLAGCESNPPGNLPDAGADVDGGHVVDAGLSPWLQQAYAKADNTNSEDRFGYSVALSADGTTLVVGAPAEDSKATGVNADAADNSVLSSGAVYVFTRSAGGWVQQAYVKASNTGAGDAFGASVALSADGNMLAVGAHGEASSATGVNGAQADDSASNSGAVYVFGRASGNWAQHSYLKASNTRADAGFGRSVSLSADGNTLAVGAHGEASGATGVNGNQADTSAPFSGAAYVFTRSSGTWAQGAYLKASNTVAVTAFGGSLCLSADGNTLAVGAHYEESSATGIDGKQTDHSAPSSGAVYVFARAAAGWAQQAYVKASNTGAKDFFSTSLALSADGNTLAVGAHREDSSTTGINGDQANDSAIDSGAVYVFKRAAATWSQQAYVKSSKSGAAAEFGRSVALSSDGNTLAVGAAGEFGSGAAVSSGSVYVFTHASGTWLEQTCIRASNPEPFDQFGHSVALSGLGDLLATGALEEDSSATGLNGSEADNAASNSGAVYLFGLR